LNDDPAFFVSVNGLLERIVDRIVCVDTDDGGTQTMGGHRRWEDTDDGGEAVILNSYFGKAGITG
jgi:hypothetical protein